MKVAHIHAQPYSDDDGDDGPVACGRCGSIGKRCEYGLDLTYLYICNDCEEKHGRDIGKLP